MNFFTADLHFGHKNIIRYCNRPFANVDEMDEALIKNWNEKVFSRDTVYIVGDLSFRNEQQTANILRRLNGLKIIILGNHDDERFDIYKNFQHFSAIHKGFLEICINDEDAFKKRQQITLCHYSMRTWNASHKGSWHLYGHSHGTLKDDPNSLSFDVGIDCHNFYPISYDEVKEIMKKKNFAPIDHHKERK